MRGILAKHGKPWLKVCTTSPLALLWNCFFLIFGDQQAYEHQHQIYLPLVNKCYTMGTYSRCLSKWGKPTSNMSGFFHHVKIIYINKGQKELHFFNAKLPLSPGIRTIGGGRGVLAFLIIPRRWAHTKSSPGSPTHPKQLTSGKATSLGTTCFIGHKFGILRVVAQLLCSPFDTKRSWSTNGELTSPLPFPDNV